jgi:branched-chain amino acid aminotransferase
VVVDGDILTPTLESGCLAGITRAILVEELGVKESDIPIEDLLNGTVTEAFLSSSFREVQPIARVDEISLAVVQGGATKLVRARFTELFNGDLDL